MITHDPQLLALRALSAPILDTEEPLAHLNKISLSAQGAAVCGHVLIDLLEENDLAIGDYEVVIAPEGDGALAAAMIHAAGGRGLDLDAALLLRRRPRTRLSPAHPSTGVQRSFWRTLLWPTPVH